MKDIIIIGGGGHAKVIAALLKKHPDWNPIGYTEQEDLGALLGLPFLGSDDVILQLMSEYKSLYAVIGIGQIKNITIRKEIISNIEATGIVLPPVISPDATVNESVEIGTGAVIMDGVILQPGVTLGKYSIVNTGATIDHDCQIGDFVHIAPGAILSGDVNISNNVLIGTGARVIQGIKIIDDVIVAAGSTVTCHLLNRGTFGGAPEKILTKNQSKNLE